MTKILMKEKELEDFLCKGKNRKNKNLKKYLDLEFIGRQVKYPMGIIDILAYSKTKKSFVIIELKKDALDYNSFFQVYKYQRSLDYRYNCNEARYNPRLDTVKRKKRFICLLIGENLKKELFYAVNYYCSEDTFEDTAPENTIFNYTLFGLSLTDGISFDFYNKYQSNIDWYKNA